MIKHWLGSTLIGKWSALVFAFILILVFIFVVAPLLQQLPGVQQVAQFIE